MAKRRTRRTQYPILFAVVMILIAAMLTVGILYLMHETGEQIDERIYFPKDEENPDRLLYADYVESASQEFEVDESVIYAVIYCESNFRADAVSSAGARGLMQMMPATFEEMQGHLDEVYDEDALFEPQISIRYGTYYLSRLYERFGNWETVYAAYNAGPTIVSKWLGDEAYSEDGKTLVQIPYSETAHYVNKVSGMVEKYKELYQTEVQK